MSTTTSTRLGRDIRGHLPSAVEAPGYVELTGRDAAIWKLAAPHLHVRNNDAHTLYAYGLARALLARLPEVREDVVLPAILLHDTGWSTVPDDQILEAIAPGAGRADLVRQHEKEGARIARDILSTIGHDTEATEQIVAIIDGHDSRRHAISPEDAIVKDADKLWRVSPHGIQTVCGWFGLASEEALRLCASRVEPALLTDPGRAMARALVAIASIDLVPQRQGLE
ncbi:HD domain-containing protein [Agromyces bauzanensis]